MKKILLACNAGMSTSLLVQKMQAVATAQSLDVEIFAGPLNKALERLADDGADILLLGPQIAYAKAEAEAAAGTVPVQTISMIDYGRMNAEKILTDALSVLSE